MENEPLRKAYIEVYSLFLNYFILSKKCTLTSRSECTKSNETLKETFQTAKLQNFSVYYKFILYYLTIVNHYLYRSRMDRRC